MLSNGKKMSQQWWWRAFNALIPLKHGCRFQLYLFLSSSFFLLLSLWPEFLSPLFLSATISITHHIYICLYTMQRKRQNKWIKKNNIVVATLWGNTYVTWFQPRKEKSQNSSSYIYILGKNIMIATYPPQGNSHQVYVLNAH